MVSEPESEDEPVRVAVSVFWVSVLVDSASKETVTLLFTPLVVTVLCNVAPGACDSKYSANVCTPDVPEALVVDELPLPLTRLSSLLVVSSELEEESVDVPPRSKEKLPPDDADAEGAVVVGGEDGALKSKVKPVFTPIVGVDDPALPAPPVELVVTVELDEFVCVSNVCK